MDQRLFTFEFKGLDPSRAVAAYPTSFKKASGALASAKAFRKKFGGYPIETRVVELVRVGTGRQTKELPGEQGEWRS